MKRKISGCLYNSERRRKNPRRPHHIANTYIPGAPSIHNVQVPLNFWQSFQENSSLSVTGTKNR